MRLSEAIFAYIRISNGVCKGVGRGLTHFLLMGTSMTKFQYGLPEQLSKEARDADKVMSREFGQWEVEDCMREWRMLISVLKGS